ncbi:MAG: glycosyltransferase family 2 protein [Chloroherpetonaceae bacterium]|nr:glycosyltransferase family 2 protein [Chloroherpetonaceae bacterium]
MTVKEATDATRPAVSVGMPVYNGQKYLRQALDALLGQTFRDFELIISDNASQDATGAICQEYASRDPRIRYFRQERTSSAQENFNFVLRQARGKYFMWAAADDLWNARYIEALYETLESDPACVCAQGEHQVIDAEGNPVGEVRAFYELEHPSRLRRIREIARGKTTHLFFYGLHRTALLQRHAVKPFHLVKKLANNSETRVLFYLVSAGTVRTNRAARFLYRAHKGSFSGKGVPVMGSLLIRTELIFTTAASVYQGSRSLHAALWAFCVSALFQTRASVSLLVRALLGRVPRVRESETS